MTFNPIALRSAIGLIYLTVLNIPYTHIEKGSECSFDTDRLGDRSMQLWILSVALPGENGYANGNNNI